jgi:uncharacterized protein
MTGRRRGDGTTDIEKMDIEKMDIAWDVPVEMSDGVVLRADVFCPPGAGPCPVLLSYGPYAKGVSFQEGYATAWQQMVDKFPDVAAGSSNRYQAWEVADPEKWVPDGYAIVRVDARGWGRSPGRIDPFGPRETRDLYECIEWAGVQPWSNGKVGLAGISYYAINQWQVAGLDPPHLAAIAPWEGMGDYYRDWNYHGGIRCTGLEVWWGRVIASVQHGLGERGAVNPHTGELACGPETLDDEELAAGRCDLSAEVRSRPLDGEFYRQRSAAWHRITVPLLSAGNWGGHGLHLRGNVTAFQHAASTEKWLELHGDEHWTGFYTDRGIALQKRFFDHYLKGVANGWPEQPRVQLRVRHVDSFVDRAEDDWPIPRTRWTRLYLNPADLGLDPEPFTGEGEVSFEALEEGVSFTTPPVAEETEITGPVSARLFISSSTTDADLFLVLRVFAPDGAEVTFQGAVDPHHPVAQGWLRASHRKLDPGRSTPHQPVHTHDEVEPLVPGQVYEVEVEVWPTSIVVPAGYRVVLTVQGKDYEYPGEVAELSHFKGSKLRGSGIYLHDDPENRPVDVFGGRTTVHAGRDHPASVLLPVIPARDEG